MYDHSGVTLPVCEKVIFVIDFKSDSGNYFFCLFEHGSAYVMYLL